MFVDFALQRIVTNIVQNSQKPLIIPSVLKNILVLGAGRSSIFLIEYLLTHAAEGAWQVTIADMHEAAAAQKAAGHPAARAIGLNLSDADQVRQEIQQADLVVSLLPADLHHQVALHCLELGRSLFTASYISNAMQAMHAQVQAKGLLFLNEMGCDPGIDHMSTMQLINEIRAEGGKVQALYSYTGGLVARDCDTNPWHYKFSWNPRNVVLAAQPGPARYLANNSIRFKPYNRIFRESERIDIPGFGPLDAYANRDSLPYKHYYGLDAAHTILRATLRYPDYCQGWSILVFLGLTDSQLQLEDCDQLSYRDFLNMFLPPDQTRTVREGFIKTLEDRLSYSTEQLAVAEQQFDYLEFFSDRKFKRTSGSPADLLLEMLEEKWQLAAGDRDLIVMQHALEYELEGETHTKTSTLLLEGQDDYHTAMAKTVGLPLAIAARLYMEGRLALTGVHIPIEPELYEPVLKELEKHGINFRTH